MAVETTAYSLEASIGALVDDMPGASTRQIAERVVQEMPEGEKDAFLLSALVRHIGSVLGKHRRLAMADGTDGEGSSRFERAKGVAWEVKLLRATVILNGRPKIMGEMDRKDCLDAAAERELHAKQTLVYAKRFKALAGILNARDLEKVAEIPVEDLKKVFNA